MKLKLPPNCIDVTGRDRGTVLTLIGVGEKSFVDALRAALQTSKNLREGLESKTATRDRIRPKSGDSPE
jgi:hypothetical protein